MDNKKRLVFLAEEVSISEQSKLNQLFLTIDVKLCDSMLNRNREGTTAAFLEDVVKRSEDHLGLPFYADVKNLVAGNYDQLGHLYDKMNKRFGTNMIGSVLEFHTETDEDGIVSLYGEIRVPKRDREIVFRLADLYEMGLFAVSVELSYDPRELVLKDGGKFIDVSENSSLTGLCLVSRPACPDAYAYRMVAEEDAEHSDIVAESEEQSERGETEMDKEEKIVAEAAEETVKTEEQNETAVAETTEPEAVKTEEVAVAEDDAKEDPEDAGEQDDKKEDAVAETQEQANAEVLYHAIDTHESVENCGGEPVHVMEVTERIVETMEQAQEMIAEQKNQIAELETQIAQLKEIEGKYNAILAAEEAKILAEKQSKARAFAEKQGLDIKEIAVAEAIEKLDYEKIMELTMAEEQEEKKEEPAKQTVALASFVELEVGNDQYGGLLNRRNK